MGQDELPDGCLPTYEVSEIERIASNLLNLHPEAAELPIPIELILERQPGVLLDVLPRLRDRHGVDGITMKDLNSGIILVSIDEQLADESRLVNRYRMTVAEELGHIILHREVIDRITSADDFKALHHHDRWFCMERNAKRFAAAVLMPPEQLSRLAQVAYPQFVKVAGFANARAIVSQMSSFLATRFRVSTQAMSYRMGEWPGRLTRRIEEGVKRQLNSLSFGEERT